MNTIRSSHREKLATVFGLAALVTLGGSLDVHAAPLTLSKVPLYTNESVDPNFVLSTDDSGSMARAYAPDQFDQPSAVLPPLFPTPISTQCWWRTNVFMFSSTANPIYFNPDIVYAPAKYANGTTMGNASFSAAWEDGINFHDDGSSTTRNLGTNYRLNWNSGGATDSPQYIEHRASGLAACNPAVESNNTVYNTFPFGAHAFYYQYTGPALPPEQGPPGESIADAAARILQRQTLIFDNANYTAMQVSDAQKPNFANWYSYYRTRNLLTRTALTIVFDRQESLRMAWQDINSPALTNTSAMRTINKAVAIGAPHRNNLFKHLYDLTPTGGTPNRAALKRVGDYFSNANTSGSTSESNPYYDITTNQVLSCRQNYHLLVTDGAWKDAAGRGTDASDTNATTLPDGTPYPNAVHGRIYSSEVASTAGVGLADNAFYYWSRDLRTDLANNVPAAFTDLTVGVSGPNTPLAADENPKDRPEIYWNPNNDPATWQHLVQFIISFGVDGTMPNPESIAGFRTNPAQNNPRTGAPWQWPNWPVEGGESPQKLDDTWHAALNSRGEYFSARNPQDLIDALSAVFLSIGKRTASNTPVSLSSGLLTGETLGYQTLFDTSDWSGRVLASRLITDPPTPEWDAACILTGGPCVSVPSAGTLPGIPANDRKIATRNSSTGAGVPFRWSSISSAQQALLNKNPVTNVTDSIGSARLDYVRGVRTQEQQNGGAQAFRNRKNLMGAVINSAAVVVGNGDGYKDDLSFEEAAPERGRSYKAYLEALTGQDTVYFGANDGMLHAVASGDASEGGGRERWAYVPAAVFANLNKLSSATALQYQSYVDATPQVRDVFIGGNWKRVLVGGLRLGGQGIYALDITNPVVADEAGLAAKVMWEYTDTSSQGADLGYTYGNPFLTRLASGDWVALVPGGYNSEVADGAAGSGYAFLYVLRIQDGAVLRKFDLGATSRGLSSVIGGDYRANGDAHALDITDVAFAGDLNGNIWRFNLQGTTAASWTVEKFFQAPANQSITVQPRILRTAYNDVGTVRRKFAVTFGTGKYIENQDRSTTFQQSYYGLFDQGPGSGDYPLDQSKLQAQSLTQSGTLRSLTTYQVPVTKRGWYFNFIATGERNISTAVVRNVSGTLIFTTLAPLSTNPCEPAAKSFLMFVDGSTGGVPGTAAAGVDSNLDGAPDSTDALRLTAPFDTNNDGVVNSADSSSVIGKELTGYVAGVTPIANVGGSQGNILIPGSDPVVTPSYEWRRRSWRELLN